MDYALVSNIGIRIRGIESRPILAAGPSVSALSRCICVAALLLAGCGQDPSPVSSTLIVNAEVYDGLGNPASSIAVRFDGDRITEVGDLAPLEGENLVDAHGLVLAPGFIDPHSHHDSDLESYRHMPGVLSQGVTTIARGLDGSYSIDDGFSYQSIADFNAAFRQRPAAVNVASFAAHGTIRATVMKDDYRRTATDDEIAAMGALVEADMQAGAIGLATGLEYEPGIFSATSEVIELAKVAARHGGTYSSHMRDEDDRMQEAIDEVIEIALNADIPANISHIKLADMEFWHTADAVIERLDAARIAGANITADIYPYLRWQANLSVLFPARNYADRAVAEYTFAHSATPENILIVEFLPNPEFTNMTIAEIAASLKRDPVDVLLELSAQADHYRRENGREGASIIAKGMHDDDVIRFMQWPLTAICSDGSHESGHPRGHGAFPRVLGRYVRELGALSLADAIYKMTSLPASTLRLEGRGRIAAGAYADLVLFDPETITDLATMAEPSKASLGIHKVWVNGVLAFDDGAPTLEYPGQIITL